MRRLPVCRLLIFACFWFIIIYIYYLTNTGQITSNIVNDKNPPRFQNTHFKTKSKKLADRIIMSFVVCDSRFNESLNVIKSVLLFTKTPVYFVIFTDDNLREQFNDTLTKWKSIVRNQLDFEMQKINFPEAHREDWMNLFSRCAAQRLFIPMLIPHIDGMIYIDTDTLFLGPADELWHAFSLFNNSQISAMALEDDNPNVSWYPRFAKHPFYGKYGLNSGVMLMNLTRMRDFGWVDYVTPIMLKWKLSIPWGDQDIINIIFHYHERAVHVLSCRYNYRSDQCMYGDACSDATDHGVFVLHGSRRAFHNNKQPAFQEGKRAGVSPDGKQSTWPIDFRSAIDSVEALPTFKESVVMGGGEGVGSPELGKMYCGKNNFAVPRIHERAMYRAIDEYVLGTDTSELLVNMEKYLTEAEPSNCGNLKEAFLRVPAETLQSLYNKPNR